eukprot:TRINITY_DN132_c0_g1::TRINITY_DN132_c0_g1_i2::g.14427::m.14427 TRINITY_DN132_c0_g1::TRINITY_DN132_c0_g1_i2::g.14427  ORF type:complete len:410 (+),score=1.41,Pkinase/PF00069.20/0.0078 TRINITY_DN132_c0_g1_i2:181-1230(+)
MSSSKCSDLHLCMMCGSDSNSTPDGHSAYRRRRGDQSDQSDQSVEYICPKNKEYMKLIRAAGFSDWKEVDEELRRRIAQMKVPTSSISYTPPNALGSPEPRTLLAHSSPEARTLSAHCSPSYPLQQTTRQNNVAPTTLFGSPSMRPSGFNPLQERQSSHSPPPPAPLELILEENKGDFIRIHLVMQSLNGSHFDVLLYSGDYGIRLAGVVLPAISKLWSLNDPKKKEFFKKQYKNELYSFCSKFVLPAKFYGRMKEHTFADPRDPSARCSNYYVLVLEKYDMDLDQYVLEYRGTPEMDAQHVHSICNQLVRLYHTYHSANQFHRDVKPVRFFSIISYSYTPSIFSRRKL